MSKLLLEAQGLCYKRQGQFVLQDCALSLYEQEVTALLGRNGAGKTTLLHLLAGLKTASSGRVHYYGDKAGVSMGYLPDKAPLYPAMRVSEYLRYCARVRGLADVEQATERVLQSCDLEAVAGQRCAALSHGYQQRVGLAQALIHQPQVIFLDEPTNGLDYGQKQSLRPLLSGLAQTASVLMISHDYEEVIAVAERVYYLHDGACHEICLPERGRYLWVSFASVPTALPLKPSIDEGCFVGFACSEVAQDEVLQQLNGLSAVTGISRHYPTAALQARLDNVG